MGEHDDELYIKHLIENSINNRELKAVLTCLGKMYGLVNEHGKIKKTSVREMICNECRTNLGVKVSDKQLRRLLRIKKRFPYKAMVILMAIYNLLKREGKYCNESEVQELIQNIKLLKGMEKLYHEFCLGGELPAKIYNEDQYAEDNRFAGIHQLYLDTYESLNKKLGQKYFIKICEDDFRFDEFKADDIPNRMKDANSCGGRQYFK